MNYNENYWKNYNKMRNTYAYNLLLGTQENLKSLEQLLECLNKKLDFIPEDVPYTDLENVDLVDLDEIKSLIDLEHEITNKMIDIYDLLRESCEDLNKVCNLDIRIWKR